KAGILVPQGLIAHGRGEAFDHLFGERTIAPALVAERARAGWLLRAKRPVLSVNGNVAALSAREVVRLARSIPARIEVNLFHRSEARVRRIRQLLERVGARNVLGERPNARVPGLESKRALSHREGVYGADVVLVPLEDGDRAEALVRMEKVVISVDLNPFSRTTRMAAIPIVGPIVAITTDLIRLGPTQVDLGPHPILLAVQVERGSASDNNPEYDWYAIRFSVQNNATVPEVHPYSLEVLVRLPNAVTFN